MGTANEIRYTEHVQLTLSMDYTRRGDLTIFLTSPMGTRSCLLPVRSEDSSDEGFRKWPFMTTHAWGEDPRGTWTLEIKDGGESRQNTGFLKDWQLLVHGTKTKPGHQNITHPDVPVHRKAVPDDTRKYGGPSEKSSVQITQITYSLATQPSAPPYPVAPVVEPPSEMVPSQQQASTSVQSFLQQQQHQQASLAAVPATASINSQVTDYTAQQQQQQQPQTYSNIYQQQQQQSGASASTLPTANKYEDYTSRTSIPSTAYNTNNNNNNNNYPTYNGAASQQMGMTPSTYDQNTAAALTSQSYTQPYGTGAVESPPTAAALAANGNLWDFFGRMNGRRAVNEDYYGPTAADSGGPQFEDWGDTNSFVQLLQRLEKINRVYD